MHIFGEIGPLTVHGSFIAKISVLKSHSSIVFVKSPSEFSLPFPNAVHELFTKWIHEINPKDWGDFTSGGPDFRPSASA